MVRTNCGKLLALLAIVGLVAAHSAEVTEEKDEHSIKSLYLYSLTAPVFYDQVVDSTIDQVRNHDLGWFVMFYAPWCGHCKRLTPMWDQFAEQHGHPDSNLRVARINCDDSENSNLCTVYDIAGYPTVLFLKGNKYYKYRGERNIEAFVRFAEGAYTEAEDQDFIPRKLEGFELYVKSFYKFLHQLGKSVEIIFDRIGFGELPHGVMYGIAGSIFMIPLTLMCYVICCMKDEVIDIEEPKKKPASINKREKIE